MCDELHIHFGLSASRHAMQKIDSLPLFPAVSQNGIHRRLLTFTQKELSFLPLPLPHRIPVVLLRPDL